MVVRPFLLFVDRRIKDSISTEGLHGRLPCTVICSEVDKASDLNLTGHVDGRQRTSDRSLQYCPSRIYIYVLAAGNKDICILRGFVLIQIINSAARTFEGKIMGMTSDGV